MRARHGRPTLGTAAAPSWQQEGCGERCRAAEAGRRLRVFERCLPQAAPSYPRPPPTLLPPLSPTHLSPLLPPLSPTLPHSLSSRKQATLAPPSDPGTVGCAIAGLRPHHRDSEAVRRHWHPPELPLRVPPRVENKDVSERRPPPRHGSDHLLAPLPAGHRADRRHAQPKGACDRSAGHQGGKRKGENTLTAVTVCGAADPCRASTRNKRRLT